MRKIPFILILAILLPMFFGIAVPLFPTPPIASAASHGISAEGLAKIKAANDKVLAEAMANNPTGAEKEYGIVCFKKDFWNFDFGECIAVLGYYMYVPTGWILLFSGAIFDTFLAFSLSKGLLNEDFVSGTWKVVRDIANLGLILALLYIAIATILQVGGVQLKKAVANVIIVALLINFSFFFTRVVIDITNTIGFHFYTMAAKAGGVPASTQAQKHLSGKVNDVTEYRISVGIMKSINPQSLMKKNTFDEWNEKKSDESVLFVVFLLAAIVNLVAAFVLFSAAFLFLGRILAFVFLIIASPLAFAAWALPAGGGGFHSKWWKQLLDQGLVAPIFLFFIYVIIKMGAVGGGYFVTDVTSISFVDFLVVVLLKAALIIAALMLALNTARGLSGKAGALTAKFAGGAMVGTAAWAGRHTIGRAAKGLQDSAAVKQFVARTGVAGEILDRGLGATARGSMDFRGLPGGKNIGLGSAGGKGGYDKHLKDQIGRKVELGKRLEKGKHGENVLATNWRGKAVTEMETIYEDFIGPDGNTVHVRDSAGNLIMGPDGKPLNERVAVGQKQRWITAREQYTRKLEQGTTIFPDFKKQGYEASRNDRDAARELRKAPTETDKIIEALTKQQAQLSQQPSGGTPAGTP